MSITMSNFGNNGGLGNQLFQWASLLGIADKNNTGLDLPKWKYSKYFNEYPEREIIEYNNQYREEKFGYKDILISNNNLNGLNFSGHFQSEKYWENNKDYIRFNLSFINEFKFHCEYKNKDWLYTKPTIAIHLRRGDYINNPNYINLPITYYILALEEYFPNWRTDYNLVVFSDDVNYAKIHFECLNNVYFPNGDELEDLCTMSLCKNHIISNSSYSWWGAYLSDSNKVVHPNCLFDGPLLEKNPEDCKDFYCEEWIAFDKWKDNRLDLKDTTFMIPYTKDSNDREENLCLLRNYLEFNFETNIIVNELETDKEAHHFLEGTHSEDGRNPFLHFTTKHENFHRTKMLNQLAKCSCTSIIINQDTDVFIAPFQIYEAVRKVREGIDVCYPYDGRFHGIERKDYYFPLKKELDIGIIKTYIPKGFDIYNTYGGCIIFKKDSFFTGGMENENFISWGAEDYERYERFTKLGYNVQRIKGVLFHLNHWIGKDSSNKNPFFKVNQVEYEKIKAMNKEELRFYINNRSWMRKE